LRSADTSILCLLKAKCRGRQPECLKTHSGFLRFILQAANPCWCFRNNKINHALLHGRELWVRRAELLPKDRARLFGDDLFFIGRQDKDGDFARTRFDPHCVGHIGLRIDDNAEPGEMTTHCCTDRRLMFPNPGCKDEPIETAERCRQRRRLFGDMEGEQVERFARLRGIARREIA
jgi:hypothetical protein